jgi:hypothetical protein
VRHSSRARRGRFRAGAIVALVTLASLEALACRSTQRPRALYEEYHCGPPVGKIVRESCSESALAYEGVTFEGGVGFSGVRADVAYEQSLLREADAMVALLKEQRVQLCHDFNTCKMPLEDYSTRQRRLEASFITLASLRERMHALDERAIRELQQAIDSTREATAGADKAAGAQPEEHEARHDALVPVAASAGEDPPPTTRAAQGAKASLEGVVTNAGGRCPAIRFEVRGRTIVTDASTRYDDGTYEDVVTGRRVEVEGVLREDGAISAREIELE